MKESTKAEVRQWKADAQKEIERLQNNIEYWNQLLRRG
jgi:gas vesicle protein